MKPTSGFDASTVSEKILRRYVSICTTARPRTQFRQRPPAVELAFDVEVIKRDLAALG